MKMSAKLEKALNEQIGAEIFSANQYLAMALQMDSQNLKGMFTWLYKQYEEEMEHAMKILRYVQERGNRGKVPAIAAPSVEYGKPLQVFEKVLAHEEHVTKLIHELHGVAVKEKDLSAQIFLNWFVTEQDEEEANANYIVDQLKLVGTNVGGLMVLDKELGARQ